MTPAEALADIRGFASAGRIAFTSHARERMAQRGARPRDVRHALTNARSCVASDDKWKAAGPDIDGDDLTCVVVLELGILVVTIF